MVPTANTHRRRRSPQSQKETLPSKSTLLLLLFFLSTLHLFAALNHFLLSVISKYVASDIHYGSQVCVSGREEEGDKCSQFETEQDCHNNGTSWSCGWEYSGKGMEYQVLAGPSFMAVYTTTSLLWGYFADKYTNRIHLLALSTAIFSLSTLFTGLCATKFWHLVVLRMALAVGVAGISPIVPGVIFDAFPEKHRALAMSFFHWGIYLGGGISNTVGRFASAAGNDGSGHGDSYEGWRLSFIVSGIPGVLIAILMLVFIREPKKSMKRSRQHGEVDPVNNNVIASRKSPSPTSAKRHSKFNHLDSSDSDSDVVIYEDEGRVLIKSGSETENEAINKIGTTARNICRGSSSFLEPSVFLLGIGACLRQAAGYTWGYNYALYYQTYYPHYESAWWWLTWITIIGGSVGVVVGGYISDRLVTRVGTSGMRGVVLGVSQLCSFPFALGTLWLPPPYSFVSLFFGYFLAEMWYGILFAIITELLPPSIRSSGLAVSLFIINNFGGNIPVLVAPLSKATSYRVALTVFYPGFLLLSSIFFFCGVLYILLKRKGRP